MQNSYTRILAGVVIILWGMGAVPGVAAERVCYTTITGVLACRDVISYGARVAIGIVLLILFSVVFLLFMRSNCLEHDEERAVAIYQIHPSQIQGPMPAPPEMTSSLPRGGEPFPLSPEHLQVRSGQFPASEQRHVRFDGLRPPQTAPVQYNSGSYPFPGYSSRVPPQTAFVGGYLRPIYTGQPIQKDDMQEVNKKGV